MNPGKIFLIIISIISIPVLVLLIYGSTLLIAFGFYLEFAILALSLIAMTTVLLLSNKIIFTRMDHGFRVSSITYIIIGCILLLFFVKFILPLIR